MSDYGIRGLESWDEVQKYHDKKLAEKDALITELCDVMEAYHPTSQYGELIQRAREAAR